MKKATVTVSFEQEKLKAVQFYAGKNGTSLELELDMFMEKLYKKYVPSQTREYIESMAEPEEQPRPRPARSPRSAAPDTFDEKNGVEYWPILYLPRRGWISGAGRRWRRR